MAEHRRLGRQVNAKAKNLARLHNCRYRTLKKAGAKFTLSGRLCPKIQNGRTILGIRQPPHPRCCGAWLIFGQSPGDREYRDCLKVIYKEAGGNRTTENYHAPGVGIIKTVYVNTTEPKSVIELMLNRYER